MSTFAIASTGSSVQISWYVTSIDGSIDEQPSDAQVIRARTSAIVSPGSPINQAGSVFGKRKALQPARRRKLSQTPRTGHARSAHP